MKKAEAVCSILMALLFTISVKAQDKQITSPAEDYKMALGIRFSTKPAIVNHSISFKYFFTQKTAGEVLFSMVKPFALGLLVEQYQPLAGTSLRYFFGGGVYSNFGSTRDAGLQGVIGLDYKIPAIPFNLSVDWKPELTLAKNFSFEPAALALSARFIIK